MEDTHTHAVGNKLSCSKALAFFTWKFLSSTKVYSPRTSLLPLFYPFQSLKMQFSIIPSDSATLLIGNTQFNPAYSLNWMFPIKNVFPIVLRCYECLTFGSAQYSTWKKCVWFWTPFYFKPHNAFSQGTPVYMFTILPYFSISKKGQNDNKTLTNHVICLKCKENHSD